MDWFALKHALFSHLPVAAGLLLPWALVAAQRPGRGIRPWWTVARYLGWTGLLGTLLALVSGQALAHDLGLLPAHRILPVVAAGAEGQLFRHALIGALTLALGGAALWAMTRPRKDHQSLGVLALLLGFLWSALLLVAGAGGYALAHHGRSLKAAAVPAPAPVRMAIPDPEAKAPVRALDFAALEAIHSDPVKSAAHGGRWIRTWVTPAAAAAYREGRPLPTGALVVVSSVEDRWGRPGPEVGPLYALEMMPSGPAFTFYWARVPMDERPAFGGDSRVYWRPGDAHLETCQACHAEGLADPTKRSRWRASRLPAKVVESS